MFKKAFVFQAALVLKRQKGEVGRQKGRLTLMCSWVRLVTAHGLYKSSEWNWSFPLSAANITGSFPSRPFHGEKETQSLGHILCLCFVRAMGAELEGKQNG